MTNTTYITSEGYEAATVNNCYTSDSIVRAISEAAKLFAHTSHKLAASARLEEIETVAVNRFGFTWEQVEAIECEAFAAC